MVSIVDWFFFSSSSCFPHQNPTGRLFLDGICTSFCFLFLCSGFLPLCASLSITLPARGSLLAGSQSLYSTGVDVKISIYQFSITNNASSNALTKNWTGDETKNRDAYTGWTDWMDGEEGRREGMWSFSYGPGLFVFSSDGGIILFTSSSSSCCC